MSFTQSQLDALKTAYAQGIRRVTYDGKTIEYASLPEMNEAIIRISRALAAASGKKRPIAGFASFNRNG